MPRIVLREKGVFLQGRSMANVVLCVNECIDAQICKSNPRVMCKLDLEKAHDHVNLNFLLYVMQRCGFGVR